MLLLLPYIRVLNLAAHLRLELGVEGVGAAAENLPHGGPPPRPVRVRVEAVLALAGVGADVLPREALAVPVYVERRSVCHTYIQPRIHRQGTRKKKKMEGEIRQQRRGRQQYQHIPLPPVVRIVTNQTFCACVRMRMHTAMAYAQQGRTDNKYWFIATTEEKPTSRECPASIGCVSSSSSLILSAPKTPTPSAL